MKKIKNKKGITLIALVVTIVVLLILAGVSISLILDNNGIIQKSKDARERMNQATKNEIDDISRISDAIKDIIPEWNGVEKELPEFKQNDATSKFDWYI